MGVRRLRGIEKAGVPVTDIGEDDGEKRGGDSGGYRNWICIYYGLGNGNVGEGDVLSLVGWGSRRGGNLKFRDQLIVSDTMKPNECRQIPLQLASINTIT
jgi:hypothetical protein